VEEKDVIEKSSRCNGWAAKKLTGGTCSSSGLGALAATAGIYSAVATAAAALSPGGLAGAGLLKLGMMMPPMLPTMGNGPTREDVDVQAGRHGFMDMLFPGFDTSSFIWKMSLLQMTEYLGSLLMGSANGAPKLCSLFLLGASWGPAIANGAIWRLFLPIMLHANALHIFFNMFFQMRIGFQMEKQFGRRKFCLLYIFCGFLGNLLSVAFDPMKLAVGASTSGFGLLGVWLAEVMLTWELLGQSRPRIFLWFAFMVLSAVMMSTISPNVDFIGHFGGALAGWLMAMILADMQEEHQPSWYGKAKTFAKNCTALLICAALFKVIVMGGDGPVPYCGSILKPRQLPF
jgi:membrane associated rhomboid family serine protease